MDIFQLVGDFLHLIAILMLVLKISATKNVIGLSYKTQEIFLVVFLSRYLDIIFGWRSLYAFLMKIIFISVTCYTIYLMRFKKPYYLSYDRESDSFPHYYLYVASLFLAIIIHKSLNPIDFLWSFSIWLQATAIIPQLHMITKLKDVENITAHYVLFLGLYRIFYIFHWYFMSYFQDFPLGRRRADLICGRDHSKCVVRRFHILFHKKQSKRSNHQFPSMKLAHDLCKQNMYQNIHMIRLIIDQNKQKQSNKSMFHTTGLNKDRSWSNLQHPRSHSPNSYNHNKSQNTSVHSQHLWNTLEELELLPGQAQTLMKNEDRNLSSYKAGIQREKLKVTHQIDNLKRQLIHNIDDLKISIHAQLDRIYKYYMERYAMLKGQIMQIKRMKDEIEIDINRRNRLISVEPKYSNAKDKGRYSNDIKTNNLTSNTNVLKSMEQGLFDMKKFHVLNYIAQLQKQKIIPMNDLSKQLIVLTQYQNGYYQSKEFSNICAHLLQDFKVDLRNIYDRKYEFIRDPQVLVQRDQQPILEGIYEQPPQSTLYKKTAVNNVIDEPRNIKISPSQQIISYDWAQDIRLSSYNSFRADSNDIVLCALEVKKNQIAVGDKDGVIQVYQASTGQKIATLKAHKSSICALAIIQNAGRVYLASGSDHGCSSIILWDTSNWTIRSKFQGHTMAVTAIVDLLDGQSIVSGSYDKRINVYNILSNKLIYNLPANKSPVTGIILNCRGNKMISCGLNDNTLNIWQVVRGGNGGRVVETMFLQRIIQNNTMICSLVGSLLQEDVIFIGTKDGKVKLINIEKGEAYKTVASCSNAIIQMVILERQTKSDHPLALCWPCKEECVKIVNCQTGKVVNFPIKGYIEFGCGIGPKGFILRNGKLLGMLSQSASRKEISFYKLDLTS